MSNDDTLQLTIELFRVSYVYLALVKESLDKTSFQETDTIKAQVLGKIT
ncbi:hypothetical protein G6Z90_12405 [Vibrio aestuarianus subsp. cardii]|nr:hypothetical protein [Vibrio aestuarianus]MDE1309763.1 hypothetical protein [Vibrio aestuarianus]MDE1309796.1 hypothetical protein [Vibrio aestuarianus]NGZ93295.1 hypothetical protein [Vibrio aestuarianus subsp. cardii]